MALELNFANATYEEVVRARDRGVTQQEYKRFEFIECLYRCNDIEEVVTVLGTSRASCYRWIKLFNERGIDGLIRQKPLGGRPPKIDGALGEHILELVANPELAQETHWTAVKLHGYLQEEHRVLFSYHTLWRYLYSEGVRYRLPRKIPINQDIEERERFIEVLRGEYKDKTKTIYFLDESGFEGDPKPRRQWIVPGKEKAAGYRGEHIRTNVIGSVNPVTGDFFSFIVPYVDQVVFQEYIKHLAEHTKGRKQVVAVLDNASWHTSPSLSWYH